MSAKFRVAVLRSDGPHNRYLDSRMRANFNVVFSAEESSAVAIKGMLRRRRFRNLSYALYHHARRSLTGKDAYRRRAFAHSPELWKSPAPLKVDSINHPAVAEGLRQAQPEVVVVMGCGILKNEVLTATDAAFINIHGGYLPYYKGNHCFFFAMEDGADDRLGSTIHFVDPGVDTGEIIEVVRATLAPGDTAEQVYCRAERAAVNRLVHLLSSIDNVAELDSFPQPPEVGKAFRMRDRGPSHELRSVIRRRFNALRTSTKEPVKVVDRVAGG